MGKTSNKEDNDIVKTRLMPHGEYVSNTANKDVVY